jgi:hypothetical protein
MFEEAGSGQAPLTDTASTPTTATRRVSPSGPDQFFRRTAGEYNSVPAVGPRGRIVRPPACPGCAERDRRGGQAELNLLLSVAGDGLLRGVAAVAKPIGRLFSFGGRAGGGSANRGAGAGAVGDGAAKAGDDAAGRLTTSESWGRLETLDDHVARHGADFGARTADEYAGMASEFLQRAQRSGLPTKVDSRGTIRMYDPKTNTFGSYNASGTTKTFYKPDPAQHGYPSNQAYWDAQPGTPPWTP